MSSRPSLVAFIVEQLGDGVRSRPMFGEYGVYRDDVLIALFCDDRLYLKATTGARALLGDDLEEAPPYPGAKPAYVIPEERWDDAGFMSALAAATARGLAAMPKKAQKRASPKKAQKRASPKKAQKRASPKKAQKRASPKKAQKRASPKKAPEPRRKK